MWPCRGTDRRMILGRGEGGKTVRIDACKNMPLKPIDSYEHRRFLVLFCAFHFGRYRYTTLQLDSAKPVTCQGHQRITQRLPDPAAIVGSTPRPPFL